MKYLLLLSLILIPSLAFATNKPKHHPVKISQGQAQGQIQGQLQGQAQSSVNKNINVNSAIADVKNDLKLSNKLYGGDSKSSSILMQGDTSSYSGGNNFYSPSQVNFVNPDTDSCTLAGTYTNDGGPYDAGKGLSLGCNIGIGQTRALKKAEISKIQSEQEMAVRDETRRVELHTLEVIKARASIANVCVSDLHPTVLIKADPMLAEFCAAYTHNENAHIDKHDAECDEDQASPHAECHKD